MALTRGMPVRLCSSSRSVMEYELGRSSFSTVSRLCRLGLSRVLKFSAKRRMVCLLVVVDAADVDVDLVVVAGRVAHEIKHLHAALA